MAVLGKNGKNCRQREFIIDVSYRSVEYNNSINNALKWTIPIAVKIGIGTVAQVVSLQEVALSFSV